MHPVTNDAVVVQSLSQVQLFATSWTVARQASLFTTSWSLFKLMSIESVMPSNHLILCSSLLLPSHFPSTRVFSNESALCIRLPKYWSFSFSISPSNEYSGLISLRIDWFEHPLICLLLIWILSFIKCLFSSFVHILLLVCPFSFLICRSYLYIPNKNFSPG